jgi:hypothetical protein
MLDGVICLGSAYIVDAYVIARLRPDIPCSDLIGMKQDRLGPIFKEEIPSSPCKADSTSWVSQPDLSASAISSAMKQEKKGGREVDITTGEEASQRSPYMCEHEDDLHQDATIIPPKKDNTCTPDTSYKPTGKTIEHYERQREIMDSLKAIKEFHEATVENINEDLVATLQKTKTEHAAMLAKLWQMCEENIQKLMERCTAKATSGIHAQTE